MRALVTSLFLLAAALPGLGQTAANAGPGLPKDPREILAAAAPFYDFTSANLKPWHLKATYQLYDEKGGPSEQGTYEYWWASPKVYRSTWTRPGATHTDWHTADDKQAYLATGAALKFFEYKLQSALLSPLPEPGDLDPAKVRLERQVIGSKDAKSPCLMVIPLMPQYGKIQQVPLGLFPTYCFDQEQPALRASYAFGRATMQFNKIAKVQNRYLAREVLIFEGKNRILSATVDSLTYLNPTNSALTPSTGAKDVNLDKVPISAAVAVGSLVKKQFPIYPQDAKDAYVSGTVVLQATIGTDGGIHDLRVVSTPWPSLAASALWSVSHWEYKPYLLNGEPVEVETTINVIYSLSN